VTISFYVDQIGTTEINSVICGGAIYLSVSEIFDFLKIRNVHTDDFKLIEGFFINQEDTYRIDRSLNQIIYRDKKVKLKDNDLIPTRNNLYLKEDYFGLIFGLHCKFSYRNLSVSCISDIELPSVKAARREKMRLNIQGLQKNFTADTTIAREWPLLHLGVATWDINSNQHTNGFEDNRASLGLGALVAGGEFTAKLNYNTTQSLLPRNQFYQWRYVNNENNFLRQLTVGKLGIQSISSIYRPVIGIQLSNSPTYLKNSFGTYLLSDYTKPNWTVEVYINNVLVDYTQADSSGFFSFNIPLVYGNTSVSLKYYGPWGEEEVTTKRLNIPYNFLPARKLEYNIDAGVIEDSEKNIFAQAQLNYGLSPNITLEAGLELNTTVEKTPIIPFARTSLRLPYNIIVSSEYLHHVGYKGNLSYRSFSNFQLELNYVKYRQEQEAVLFNYNEERRVVLSKQLHFGKFSGFSRMVWRQNLLRNVTYTNSEWLFAGRAYGVNINLITSAYFSTLLNEPKIYSRLSTTINLPKKIVFSPQVEYEYNSGRVSSIRGNFRKQIFKNLQLQASYDQNFKYDQFNLNIGFNFELGFSRGGLSSNTSKFGTSFSESIGGSMIFDPEQKRVKFNNRSYLGQGSIKFITFLDTNLNGKKDESEPRIEGVNVLSTNGGIKEVAPEGYTIYRGLEPFVNNHFKLDTSSLGRIDWKLKNQSLNIFVNPNQLKVIEIAINVVGEVAGYVYKSEKGVGSIKIIIKDDKQHIITSLISESDGYFNFLGLKSGAYTAQVDPDQLERLKWEGIKTFYNFNIENTKEGDYVDNLEFALRSIDKNPVFTKENLYIDEGPAISDKKNNVHEIDEKDSISKNPDFKTEDVLGLEKTLVYKVFYNALEGGAKVKTTDDINKGYSETTSLQKADSIRSELQVSGFPEAHIGAFNNGQRENGMYKYTWGISNSVPEADQIKNRLQTLGFQDAYVVPFYDNKRLSHRQIKDTILFKGKRLDGIGGIKINVFDSINNPAGSGLSEADGNFRISGLRPGPYTVHLDKGQLSRINMRSRSNSLKFRIHENDDLSMGPLEFILEDSENEDNKLSKYALSNNTGLIFRVQVLASNPKLSIHNKRLKGLKGVKRYKHRGIYKFTWGEGRTLQEVRPLKKQLQDMGFQDAFIVPFYNEIRLNMQEAIGKIILDSSGRQDGLEGIRIYIYDSDGAMVTTLISKRDGHFSFLGLKPGIYKAKLDRVQLDRLQLKAKQGSSNFEIGKNTEGNLSDRLEFILEQKMTTPISTYNKKDQGDNLVFKVQIAASNIKLSPNHPAFTKHKEIDMYIHQNMYKYTVKKTRSYSEVNRFKEEIRLKGERNAFVVAFLNNKRISLEEALQILNRQN